MDKERDVLKCPVCGGTMKVIAIIPTKQARVKRFKCTCGHGEDLPESGRHDRGTFALEGFQEF